MIQLLLCYFGCLNGSKVKNFSFEIFHQKKTENNWHDSSALIYGFWPYNQAKTVKYNKIQNKNIKIVRQYFIFSYAVWNTVWFTRHSTRPELLTRLTFRTENPTEGKSGRVASLVNMTVSFNVGQWNSKQINVIKKWPKMIKKWQISDQKWTCLFIFESPVRGPIKVSHKLLISYFPFTIYKKFGNSSHGFVRVGSSILLKMAAEEVDHVNWYYIETGKTSSMTIFC